MLWCTGLGGKVLDWLKDMENMGHEETPERTLEAELVNKVGASLGVAACVAEIYFGFGNPV